MIGFKGQNLCFIWLFGILFMFIYFWSCNVLKVWIVLDGLESSSKTVGLFKAPESLETRPLAQNALLLHMVSVG